MEPNSPRPLLLVFPFGYLSHYLRCLVLARHLEPLFTILFARDDRYAGFIAGEGFGTFPCQSPDADMVLQKAKHFDFSWLNEEVLEPVFLSQVAAIKHYRPAAVLGDASPTLKMAAEHTGVPFISLINGYMSRYYAAVRSLSRTHVAYPYLSKLPQSLRHFLTAAGERQAMRQVHKPFNKLRSRYGLATVDSYTLELEGDLTLICDLDRLFPQKPLPAHYIALGPLIYEPQGEPFRPPGWPNGKKTLFVSMGSTGDWPAVAFLNHPHFHRYHVITAGDAGNVLQGPHIIRSPFTGMRDLLPFTDLVICHGGNGTIYQALYYGVPMLFRTSHFEQEWNVQAMERAGLGRSLDGISGMAALIAIVEEWMSRKGDPVLETIAAAIRAQVDTIPGRVAKLAEALPA